MVQSGAGTFTYTELVVVNVDQLVVATFTTLYEVEMLPDRRGKPSQSVYRVADGGTSVVIVVETDKDTPTELVDVWKAVVDTRLEPPACTQLCFASLHDDA
jgi:hypothetical protein